MKSVAILAIVLAVFTAQVSAWSNSSNSSNHTTSSVQVVFDHFNRSQIANVSAHFNHQDDVIITVSGSNSSYYTKPILNITNLAGNFWVQNATSILSVLNQSNTSTTYRFRYYGVFMENRPCALTYSQMTCRFKLYLPTIQESTDLYFTFDQPYSYMPAVHIVGAGYNNRTFDRSIIYAREVEYTEYLKRFINLTCTGDYYSKNQERYVSWNASNFNASWMISSMQPKFLGFQCWGARQFNLIANWTGRDYLSHTPVNLSRIGLPFDNFYICNMTIVFTESSNNHSLIPIQVQGPIIINGTQSNHSNDTNTTSETWGIYAGYNKGCNISANFTRWDGVDLTLTAWGSNFSYSPMMNLTNYAGQSPVWNTSRIFRQISSSNRSTTYRFNYWDAIGSTGPCVSYETYSVGCRFKLWMSGVSTDLFITITRPFLAQNISIHGGDYDNSTWNSHWIDLTRADFTQYLLKSVDMTIDSDYFSQSRVRYLHWNSSNFNASWMMSSLRPVAFGFQCTEDYNGSYINVVVNYTGSDGFYGSTPVYLNQSLPNYGFWSCNMSVIATERRNNHAMFQINVRNQFYINGTGNYSGYWYGEQRRSNFSDYRALPNTSYVNRYNDQSYYTNNTYYNQSRNSSNYTYGNASWYSHENPYYSNQTYFNYTYYNYTNRTTFNQSRNNTYNHGNWSTTSNFSTSKPYYGNQTYFNYTYYNYTNHTTYNQSRNNTYVHSTWNTNATAEPYYGNQTFHYNQSRFNNQSTYYHNNTGNTYYSNNTYINQNGYNETWYPYSNESSANTSNATNGTSKSIEFCEIYENRLHPTCLEAKVKKAKLVNKILIGCVAVLALGLLLLACKVCCQKKTPSNNNSPQSSYIEFGQSPANTSRGPQMVIHGNIPTQPMQTITPAAPAYLISGQDGAKFMVIPQKI